MVVRDGGMVRVDEGVGVVKGDLFGHEVGDIKLGVGTGG